jgi:hypothetical protein
MLTKEEKLWVKKMQILLNACPSDRLGFFAIGDADVTIYDKNMENEIHNTMDGTNSDFGPTCDELDAVLGHIIFPNQVLATAG